MSPFGGTEVAPPSRRAARVLIIEDNPINLELLEYLLQSFGHGTLRAIDGAIGLDVARRERPDLILCDIQMPGMDGLAVLKAMRADDALREIPIVAITALAMVGDRERLLAAGFDGYVAKPIDPKTLIGTLDAFLPATLRAASPPLAPREREVAASRSVVSATVLVIDDTPINIELKRALLEPNGFEVLTASCLADALALATARHVDLVISDVGLRVGSGFDVLSAFKADPALRDVPFMFLTSTYLDSSSRERALALGAVRYVTRPLDARQLLAEISGCLHV